jgi:nicotinic acid mononucleotide adenylyltransferase
LLKSGEFVVGLRSQDKAEDIKAIIEAWPVQPRAVTMFESYAPDVSSGRIREALRRRKSTKGLLKSVERYSDHNWLYISLA